VAPLASRCYAPLQLHDETKEIRVSLCGFGAFCAVYFLAVATPGPGVTALLARSLAHGMRGAAAYIAGFLIGDLTWPR